MVQDLPSRRLELSAEEWCRRPAGVPLPLDDVDLDRLAGLDLACGGPAPQGRARRLDRAYLPVAHLIELQAASHLALSEATAAFIGRPTAATPLVIGIAGGVAVGKSTTARLLQALLSRAPSAPQVDLVNTDGFLLPNAELERRGLMGRKGFPESYDRRRLLRFLDEVKGGDGRAAAPVYSHVAYDIVPGELQVVDSADIVLVEGLNILSTSTSTSTGLVNLVSDRFDFTIYVDADEPDIEAWYVERFLGLCATVFQEPSSYFHRYAHLDRPAATATARRTWDTVNAVNLRENILPTRGRADLILEKGPDHQVRRVLLRTP